MEVATVETATPPTIIDAAIQSGRMEIITVGAEPPSTPESKEVQVPKPTPKPKDCLKAVVSTRNLAVAAAVLKPFVNTRSQLPILSNVSLTVNKAGLRQNRIAFYATDLDCGIQTSVEAGLRHVGSTTLPVKQLADVLKGADEDINIEADAKDKIVFKSGGMTSEILGLPAEEYPAVPLLEAHRTETLPQATLKRLFKRVECAQSTDETRYVLNGVLLQRKDGCLRAVTTDGRRLAMLELEQSVGKDFSVIIPSATVDKVGRLLGESDDVTIEVQYGIKTAEKDAKENIAQQKKQKAADILAEVEGAERREIIQPVMHSENYAQAVRFTFDATVGKGKNKVTLPVVIHSRIIEGTFPNYRQVIPTECLLRIELPRKELLDRVSQVSGSIDHGGSIKLQFTKDDLYLCAYDRDMNKRDAHIALKGDPGKERCIAFNPGFLSDALRSVPENATVLMEMVDELSPGVFKVKDQRWLYVLMVMRLN